MSLFKLTEEEEIELEYLLTQEIEYKRYSGAYDRYFNDSDTRNSYKKHWQFFDAGNHYRQRLFRAANRVGKTTGAGCELVYHLTGVYPDEWKGKRFKSANSWWVCGKSSETIRQILQPLLLGGVGDFGSGLVPRDKLDFNSLSEIRKAATGVDAFRVWHVSGEFSQVEFKAYDQGRQAFEGTERSIWCDEEPPLDVYSECLLRTMTGDNILILTFTPMKGASDVVRSFAKEGNFEEGEVGVGKHVTSCTWDDVPHLDETAKAELLASIPQYQRDARSRGIPVLGAGAIWPVQEADFVIPPQVIPKHFRRCFGMDVGNKTAAIWLAIDDDSGTLWAYAEYYREREEPSIHSNGILSKGKWIPGAIDPASRGRSQIDGQQLMVMYQELGLDLTKAINAVESGLYTVWELLSTGRLKVFSSCTYLLQEMRSYQRDEKGRVIKLNDHCCDAFRYAVMTRDIGKVEPVHENINLGMPTHRPRF